MVQGRKIQTSQIGPMRRCSRTFPGLVLAFLLYLVVDSFFAGTWNLSHNAMIQSSYRHVVSARCPWDDLGSVRYGSSVEKGSDVLVVTLTSNIWNVTKPMINSLRKSSIPVSLLVIDDFSNDDTYEILKSCGIWVMRPEERDTGVTAIWNRAFEIFEKSDFTYLVMTNNDVLIPTSTLGHLIATFKDTRCSMAIPLSSRIGKGAWPSESFEHVYGGIYDLPESFVHNASNYECIQKIVENSPSHKYGEGHIDVLLLPGHINPGFLGFFYAFSRMQFQNITNGTAAFLQTVGEQKNVHQEQQIAAKVYEKNGKICLNPHTFVYHHKGATRIQYGW